MARLSYAKKKRLPRSSFALKRERKYPIIDEAHARAALARAAHNEPLATQRYIAEQIKERFPRMEIKLLRKRNPRRRRR